MCIGGKAVEELISHIICTLSFDENQMEFQNWIQTRSEFDLLLVLFPEFLKYYQFINVSALLKQSSEYIFQSFCFFACFFQLFCYFIPLKLLSSLYYHFISVL